MKRLLVSAAMVLAVAGTSASAQAMSCVAFVKSVTDLGLSGNAWAWWDGAEHLYERDHKPAIGAVMVFQRTRHMPLGHIALVSAVNGPREILIDHANWHRGRVEQGTIVRDISDKNDWSRVSVQWQGQVFGNPTPVNGFIYLPEGASVRPFHAPDVHLMLAKAHSRHRHATIVEEAQLEQRMIRQGRLKLASFHGADKAQHSGAHPSMPPHIVLVKKTTPKY
jgi:hypothetical protein